MTNDFSSDWRYNDGNMHARQFCLNAFVYAKIPLTRDVYEFCALYISQGLFQQHLDSMKEGGGFHEKAIHDEILTCYHKYGQEFLGMPDPLIWYLTESTKSLYTKKRVDPNTM